MLVNEFVVQRYLYHVFHDRFLMKNIIKPLVTLKEIWYSFQKIKAFKRHESVICAMNCWIWWKKFWWQLWHIWLNNSLSIGFCIFLSTLLAITVMNSKLKIETKIKKIDSKAMSIILIHSVRFMNTRTASSFCEVMWIWLLLLMYSFLLKRVLIGWI